MADWKWSEAGFIDVPHEHINQNGHKAVTASCAILFLPQYKVTHYWGAAIWAKFGGVGCPKGPQCEIYCLLWFPGVTF